MLYKIIFELLYSIDEYFGNNTKKEDIIIKKDKPKMSKVLSFSDKTERIELPQVELPTMQEYIHNWNEERIRNKIMDTPEDEQIVNAIIEYKTNIFFNIKNKLKNKSPEIISEIASNIAILSASAFQKDSYEAIEIFFSSCEIIEHKYVQVVIIENQHTTYNDDSDSDEEYDSDDDIFSDLDSDDDDIKRIHEILNKRL